MSNPVVEGMVEGFALPPDYTVAEWADLHVVLPPELAAEPGRWRTDRAPYQREPMDCLTDPHIDVVVMKTSAQVGKTSILLNGVGYHIHHSPAPMMLIQPTLEMAEAFSKDKLSPLLRETPALRERVAEERSRTAANTIRHKQFPGGFLSITGANSPTSLRMRSVKIVWADEVDAYPAAAGDEGDPVKLATKRTQTFHDSKLVAVSTPANKGSSRIDAMWEASDKRRFFVPCPDCGHEQHLVWDQVVGKEGPPKDACYSCEQCGTLWTDAEIKRQVRLGRWIATAPFTGTAGFHLWQIYSPWSSLGEIVKEWQESEGKPTLRQVWVNTVLGEVYDASEEAGATPEQLLERREDYPAARLPERAAVVTAGVDVQADRLECLIKCYGAENESWVLEHLKIYGDPSGNAPWNELEEVLKVRLAHPSGRTLGIEAVAIDSGYLTQTVYKFCTKHFQVGRRWYAIKGQAGPAIPAWKQSEVRIKGGARLYIVGVDTLKEAIYRRLANMEPGEDFIHFPARDPFDKEWFTQLTVERVRTVHDTKGFPKREWHKPDGARNEALDLNVYADAAHSSLNVNHAERLAMWFGRRETADAAQVARMFMGG